MKTKDVQVRKLEDTNYGLEVKIKDRDVKTRNLQEKVCSDSRNTTYNIIYSKFFDIVTETEQYSDQRTGIATNGGAKASKAARGLQNSRANETTARRTSV